MEPKEALSLILEKAKEKLDSDTEDCSGWYYIFLLAHHGLGTNTKVTDHDIEWAVKTLQELGIKQVPNGL